MNDFKPFEILHASKLEKSGDLMAATDGRRSVTLTFLPVGD